MTGTTQSLSSAPAAPDLERRLHGVWRLLAWTITLRDGTVTHPFGRQPTGTLVYTSEGTVHVHFMRQGRDRLGLEFGAIQRARRHLLGLESDAPAGLDLDDVKRVMLDASLQFNAYCGRYRVEGTAVYHAVEIALIPNWEGVTLKREVLLKGNELVLSADLPEQRDELIWLRDDAAPLPGPAGIRS